MKEVTHLDLSGIEKRSDGKKKEHIYVCMQCDQKYVRKRQ